MTNSLISRLSRIGAALAVLFLMAWPPGPAQAERPPKNKATAGKTAAQSGNNQIGTNLGGQGPVAARLRGKPIFRNKLNSPDLAKARKEVFQLEQRLLRQEVISRLAKERPKEFGIRPVKVTDKEIREIYGTAGLKGRGSLASYRARIHAYILRSKTTARQSALFEKALRKGYVKSFLKAPPPFLFRLAPVERAQATRGARNAPIHLVEFSDFQ